MKFFLLVCLLALGACGSHDSDGPRVSNLVTTQDGKVASVKASTDKTLQDGKVASVKASTDKTFAQVQEDMQKLLACEEYDQVAYSRPTKVSFISDGFSKVLLGVDKVVYDPVDEDEIKLEEDTAVRRVFARVSDGAAVNVGKLAVALLVLPEDELRVAKEATLKSDKYWVHHNMALLAFQCVDIFGDPVQANTLKVSDRYLTFNDSGKAQVEIGRSKEEGLFFNAQRGALVLKVRHNEIPSRDNVVLGSIENPRKSKVVAPNKADVARWFNTATTNRGLATLLSVQQKNLAAENQAMASKLAENIKNKQENQKNIAELNAPDRRSIVNRPATWYYRAWNRHYNNNIQDVEKDMQLKLSILTDEISLLGD